MDALDESWVERKLLTASNTQESVQSLSMWALHHKTQHERIVAIWFRVLKAAKLDLRLTLFYLCNEVVQTCRRRHAVVYKDAFREVLRDAALLVRDVSIRPNIERIFKIWAERGVYDAEFVEELLVLLNNAKVKTAMSTKLLADFTPSRLMDQLMSCAQLEDAVEEQRQALANVDVNALDVESFKHQLKDRNQGIEYAEELEAACRQIKNYVNNLETEMKERAALVELLEQSQLFYDAQSSEANMVAMAYKTFGSRVAVVQKKLQEHRAVSKASVSSQGDCDSSQDCNEREYRVDSPDSTTPRSYDASEDSNSPLQYFNPADYFDEPIDDQDIFLFPSENKTTSDASRRQSLTESTPGRISKMEPPRRTSSTEYIHRISPEPFDLFPSETELSYCLSPSEQMPAKDLSSRKPPVEPSHWMSPTDHVPPRDRSNRTSSVEQPSRMSPTDRTSSRERNNRLSSAEQPRSMSPTDHLSARERNSRLSSAEQSRSMTPTDHVPTRERNNRLPSTEQTYNMSPTDRASARERNSRLSSAEQSRSMTPTDHVPTRERNNRLPSTEQTYNMSPTDRASARERSSRTSSGEHSHRMSPTERANLLFPKESFSRTVSSDLSHNSDCRVSSQLDYDTEPVPKRTKTDASHFVSSVEDAPKIANLEPSRRQTSKESLRKLSTESETSSRNRRYSYSSSSSSLPPLHTTPQRTRSKDSIGSDGYVQPALSFLPRNIGSLGSQKHPPELSNLFPNNDLSRGGATPTRDEEGGATPVLDEPEDDDINYLSPMDQTASATKPSNSYSQLPRQTNLKGGSDHNTHHERQSYSTGSDIGSDVMSSYDKARSNAHYAPDLEQTRPRAVDNSRSITLYPSDAGERYRPAESYRSQDLYHPGEQEYHPSPVTVTLPGYHQSPADASLSSTSRTMVDNFQAVVPVDLPPPITYYPVVVEQYSNSSVYSDPPKPQIYQQPPPDFSQPPPAIFNPSLPPPGMSLSSMSLGQPPSASSSYSLPPPLPSHSGTLVMQQPGTLINSSQPPPRVVQITVLPGHVDVFNPTQIPTSSHLPPLLPPTTVYSTQLAAPPRRTELITQSGDYKTDLPSSGGFITTIGGNGDTRRNTYSRTELTPTQPIRSITSSRRNDRNDRNDRSEYSLGSHMTNASTVGSSKILSDYVDHTGHVAYDHNETEQEALRIPTLGYSVHNDNRGQRILRNPSNARSQPPWS